MTDMLRKFGRDESGATAIEYGLIAALIAVVILGAVAFLGVSLTNVFSEVGSDIPPD